MSATMTMPTDMTLFIEKSIAISAPLDTAFRSLLRRLGPDNGVPDHPMPMTLEPWPGGRWFRDLGSCPNGGEAVMGHLWGHVQVIKPPTLLEITGPMFMSYPVAGHIQFRLTEDGGGTMLQLTHRAIGCITDEHREGVNPGWQHLVDQVKAMAERA